MKAASNDATQIHRRSRLIKAGLSRRIVCDKHPTRADRLIANKHSRRQFDRHQLHRGRAGKTPLSKLAVRFVCLHSLNGAALASTARLEATVSSTVGHEDGDQFFALLAVRIGF